jgi:hypothetical protein
MRDAYLTPEDLDLLMESDGENVLKRILLHHLSVCPACHAVGGFLLDALAAGEIDEDLDGFSIDLYRSRLHAPALWKELQAKKPRHWKNVVKKDRHYWSWGLAELLCQRSLDLASVEPVAALAAAELAVEVGMRVYEWDPDNWVQLLRGLVWAHLGHARRSFGDFSGALQAFAKAQEIWGPAFANYGDVLGYEARFSALSHATMTRDSANRSSDGPMPPLVCFPPETDG